MSAPRTSFHRFSILLAGCLLLSGLLSCGTSLDDDAPLPESAHTYNPFPALLPFAPEKDGWQTNTEYPPFGDPRARRDPDFTLKVPWDYYPPTLRYDGPNGNLTTTHAIYNLMYENLVSIHPDTLEFYPRLATHWKIERHMADIEVEEEQPDGGVLKRTERREVQTFTFRINPKARFADGSEVTANDVHASWWHMVQEDRKDPMNLLVFGDYQKPKILDKYTIRVTTKKLNWRLFMYFGNMNIYPARYVRVPGIVFLKTYNWRYMPGSGPYQLDGGPQAIKKGDSLTLVRRDDWWAENERWAKHTFNFQRIKYIVVRDPELIYEMFKKGEFDWYRPSRAQQWVQEIPREETVRMGWIKQRKVFTRAPQGFMGFCFNMRKPPFNDKRIRLAFCHLFNRERLFEKLFFNQYEYVDTYFPGRDWGHPDNPKIRFDPHRASELLAEAGFTRRDDEGYLINDRGERLEVTLPYAWQAWERIWLIVREDYEDAGVKFNLQLMDPTTLMKQVTERNVTFHFQNWASILFPNPKGSWHSSLADQPANNNMPGFKNDELDRLCDEYDVIFDRKRQKEIIRRIDEIIFNEHPYALAWFGPFVRILYWDKFGHPETWVSQTCQDPEDDIIHLWWHDPDKGGNLEKAMEENRKLEQGPIDHSPWKEEDR